jgi:hypothetical protein
MKRLIVTIAAAVLLMTVAAFGQPPCTNNPSTANMPCVWFPQPAPLPKSPLPPVPDPRDFDREMQRIAQQQERDAQKVYIPKPTPTPEPTPAPAYTPAPAVHVYVPPPDNSAAMAQQRQAEANARLGEAAGNAVGGLVLRLRVKSYCKSHSGETWIFRNNSGQPIASGVCR